MKKTLVLMLAACSIVTAHSQIANSESYLENVKTELSKEWPNNRAINLVFHGHSVPSGYFATPTVNTLAAYPVQTLIAIKQVYKTAVVNCITTAVGGENSAQGEMRFESDVLTHKPDVIFIDYALNDRAIGIQKAKSAWINMIEMALNKGVKIILLTPTADTKEDILNCNSELALYANMIKELAVKYNVGLVDSYEAFKNVVQKGQKLDILMSQSNHPNELGHKIVVNEIIKYF